MHQLMLIFLSCPLLILAWELHEPLTTNSPCVYIYKGDSPVYGLSVLYVGQSEECDTRLDSHEIKIRMYTDMYDRLPEMELFSTTMPKAYLTHDACIAKHKTNIITVDVFYTDRASLSVWESTMIYDFGPLCNRRLDNINFVKLHRKRTLETEDYHLYRTDVDDMKAAGFRINYNVKPNWPEPGIVYGNDLFDQLPTDDDGLTLEVNHPLKIDDHLEDEEVPSHKGRGKTKSSFSEVMALEKVKVGSRHIDVDLPLKRVTNTGVIKVYKHTTSENWC